MEAFFVDDVLPLEAPAAAAGVKTIPVNAPAWSSKWATAVSATIATAGRRRKSARGSSGRGGRVGAAATQAPSQHLLTLEDKKPIQ